MKSFLEKNYTAFVWFGIALGLLGSIAYLIVAVGSGSSTGDWSYELQNIWIGLPFIIPTLMGFFTFLKRPANWSVSIAYFILGLVCLFVFALFAFSGSALGTSLVVMTVLLPIAGIITLFLIIRYFIKK